ncbi:HAD family hydrolase [Glutamicibacter sp. PS]|uniref:HAD family hydrolase n=1 Tax=Glutamicibacter sp. PS TaxID=3075634 RepID=UPI00284F8975|nr:HAD family hydrolase [Glutamicibacter sp. PS]MDR4534874.1 HAD family hydrolase [Glutamicibacter sp. PS]
MIRLIASDLDGTIITPGGTISQRTREAFLAARDAGIEIVFVTGRPYRWLDPVVEAFGGLGSVICSNGAVLYDLASGEILFSRTLSAATARTAAQIILEHEPQASFAAETTKGLHLGPGFTDPHRPMECLGELDLNGPVLDSEGIVKFLARSPHLPIDDFYGLVAEQLGQMLSVTHSAFDMSLLEMAHVEIDKAQTLRVYAERLGIAPEEVMAFGDMPNDLQMLSYAGHGYAMASGHALVRHTAEYLAPPLLEDGVAQVIEGILK